MFDSKHYVPILKWKRAEQRALRNLEEKDRDAITPLIELVMPTVLREKKGGIKKTLEEVSSEVVEKFKMKRIKAIPEEIAVSWGTMPVFLDFSLLHDGELTTRLKIDSITRIMPAGIDLGLKVVPVLNLNDAQAIKAAVSSLLMRGHSQGICLRITASDLPKTGLLNEKIGAFLSDLHLSERDIDLLIDIKQINEKGGQHFQCMNSSQKIRNLATWRNLIFASGAFPEDLSECRFQDPTPLPRFDWQHWLYHIKAKGLERNPTFADYAIRNPVFREELQYHNPTTSIRYTCDNDWMIMKGKKRRFEYYLANAKLLVEATGQFYGESFSWGDQVIAQKAKHYDVYAKDHSVKGTGSNEDWIAVGINHHLKVVVNQIASLVC